MSPRPTTLLRAAALLVFALGALLGAAWSHQSYEKLRFYRYEEPDASLAESYEMELWLEVPGTLLCVGAALAAGAPLLRRR